MASLTAGASRSKGRDGSHAQPRDARRARGKQSRRCEPATSRGSAHASRPQRRACRRRGASPIERVDDEQKRREPRAATRTPRRTRSRPSRSALRASSAAAPWRSGRCPVVAVLGAHDRPARSPARRCASCASPSAESSVVRGLPSSSRRTPLILPSAADLGDHLRRATADLHDVDARPLLRAALARRLTGIALQILAVGHEDHDAHVVLRLRVAREDLARPPRARAPSPSRRRACRWGRAGGRTARSPRRRSSAESSSARPRTPRRRSARPGRSWMSRATSAFARAMRLGAMSRAYMLFE